VIALALRTWVRYLVPLTLLAIVACAPLAYVAWGAKPATDVATARAQVRLAWGLAAVALTFQILLVAAAAPMVRAVAAATPLSQLAAVVAGLRGLVRGLLPWLVAMTAVILGGVALVVPGALLAVLVSLTGASDRLPSPQAAIGDSVATVRAQLPRMALLVLAIVSLDLAITLAAQLTYVPVLAKKAPAAKLLPIRTFVRITAFAILACSSLPACLLAAAYSHAKRR
jgi:hypothetical protein